MAQIGDAFTVGMILILIFGGVFFYLYTRLTQAEKKVSLLESILLDLKAATEGCFMGFPEHKPMAEYYEGAEEGDEEDDVLQNLPFAHASSEPGADNSGSSTPKSQRSAAEAEATKTIAVPSSGAGMMLGTPLEDLELPDAAPVGTEFSVNKVSNETNYDNMSMKELQALARSRGVSGISSMRRQKLISTLKDLDAGEESPVEETAPTGFNFGSAAVEDDGMVSDLVESATPL